MLGLEHGGKLTCQAYVPSFRGVKERIYPFICSSFEKNLKLSPHMLSNLMMHYETCVMTVSMSWTFVMPSIYQVLQDRWHCIYISELWKLLSMDLHLWRHINLWQIVSTYLMPHKSSHLHHWNPLRLFSVFISLRIYRPSPLYLYLGAPMNVGHCINISENRTSFSLYIVFISHAITWGRIAKTELLLYAI